MKILIFSMTCGEGHNSIAKSLKKEFENSFGSNVECEIMQTYGFDEGRIEKENQRFLKTCKTIPHLYDMVWNMTRKRNFSKPSKIFDNEIKDCCDYFIEKIEEFNPNLIICTHTYAGGVVDKLIREGKIDKEILTATVVFDFCLSPYWEFSKNLDYIFSPMAEMTQDLIARGYNEDQIVVTGIPVREQIINCNKEKNGKGFTVLMIAGGNGIGNTFKVFKSIVKNCPDVNIIVINGRNKISFNQIEEYIQANKLTNIQNLGFVADIENYFAQADVFVSRCGGCGISEMLCFSAPFIIREKMIINEKINKKMFVEKGCALGMKRISDAGKLVKKLKDNPNLQKEMACNCQKFAKPNATKEIVDFLVQKMQDRNNKN